MNPHSQPNEDFSSKHFAKLQALTAEALQNKELQQLQTSIQAAVIAWRVDRKRMDRRARLERAITLLCLWFQFGCLVWVQVVQPLMQQAAVVREALQWTQTWSAEHEALQPLPAASDTDLIAPTCLPLQLPSTGQQTSGFGWRDHPITGERKMHHGIDLAAGYGSPIRAAAVGSVTTVGDAGDGYGLKIIIQHPYDTAEQFETLYAHLSEVTVTTGSTVLPGQVIGFEGSSGRATGSHLHFEVRVGGEAQDPYVFIGQFLGGSCQ